MCKTIFYLFVFFSLPIFSQQVIGEVAQAQILKDSSYYEVIFKNNSNEYSSFYIQKDPNKGTKGLTILKKHIFHLFKEPKKKDFLLQFVEDSVFLVYKDKKIKMEVWKGHDSDHRETSAWLSYTDYLHLFSVTPKKGNL